MRPYLALTKPRTTLLLVLVALTSAMVAAGDGVAVRRLAFLACAGLLASAGSAALNHYWDRDIDAQMERTRTRPLPSGQLQPRSGLLWGLALLAVALLVALGLNLATALAILSGAFVYVVVYSIWLKRRSAWNVVVGGLAGSCAVAAGWLSVGSAPSLGLLLLALLVFFWTPAHFWSFALVHRDSYAAAGIPMLPTVVAPRRAAQYIALHGALLLAVSVLVWGGTPLGAIYLTGAVLLGGLFVLSTLRLWRQPGGGAAWSTYKASGLYLGALFGLMVLDALW